MTKVSKILGLALENRYGLVDQLDSEPDVILLPHSMLRTKVDWPYRAVRMIRDPRDVWVSGYLYHRHCDEEWCTNNDTDPMPPIQWPRVDYAFEHWPEDWKRRYLERLNHKSYQQNMLDRSTLEGLEFELEGYTGCTLSAMREWELNHVDALDVMLEDVMADFDGAMRRIFDHFGFTAKQSWDALEVARTEESIASTSLPSPLGHRSTPVKSQNGVMSCRRSRSPGSRTRWRPDPRAWLRTGWARGCCQSCIACRGRHTVGNNQQLITNAEQCATSPRWRVRPEFPVNRVPSAPAVRRCCDRGG